MTPEQTEALLAGALGLHALPAGDLAYTLNGADGLRPEMHLAAPRDFLMLVCPVADMADDSKQGASLGALLSNLTSARAGAPALVIEPQRQAVLARSVLWLAPLEPQELLPAIEAFAGQCLELRQNIEEAAQAL